MTKSMLVARMWHVGVMVWAMDVQSRGLGFGCGLLKLSRQVVHACVSCLK